MLIVKSKLVAQGGTGNIKSFEDLECWKACVDVRRYISKIVKKLPPHEKFDMVDNMKRAARSSTRDIAEGYGRFHFKENIQFCRHSRGSLYELIDDLLTCLDEDYINEQELKQGREIIQKALNILNGYINYLRRADVNK